MSSIATSPIVINTPISPIATQPPKAESITERLSKVTADLMASLPAIDELSSAERRGIIARYSTVLEGNFIYWMTGALMAAKSPQTREIIEENLLEEIRDCHPGMLRRFCLAARAVPDDYDAHAVYPQLAEVRLFIGKLSPAPILAMMAFFEGFIQQFMAYLAELAIRQGSGELEYTDVHGVCDVAHSAELYRALDVEMALANDARDPEEYLFEGVYLLRALIEAMIADPTIVRPQAFANVN